MSGFSRTESGPPEGGHYVQMKIALILETSGWAGFSRKFVSSSIIALGTANTADRAEVTQAFPITASSGGAGSQPREGGRMRAADANEHGTSGDRAMDECVSAAVAQM